MSESDWTALTSASNNALDPSNVSKGATQAFTVPNGGGSSVLGLHSIEAVEGFAGWLFTGDSDFAPIAGSKGGVITAALRKQSDGGDYAPIIGLVSGSLVDSNKAYMLGLSNDIPYKIVLRKGLLISGLDPASSDVLRQSNESYSDLTLWHHLRLEVLVNPHGEVRVNAFKNDLTLNAVSAPVWEAIDGMDGFIDDSLSVLTGTPPLTSGFRPVIGMYNGGNAGAVGLIDHITIARQQNP
jgi:hypothetical protein